MVVTLLYRAPLYQQPFLFSGSTKMKFGEGEVVVEVWKREHAP